ncbi:squalene cyclase [Planctomonas sp. JC2975]|uniref:squalene cyclase n=1 Tax=Planctomonas sp. JC2975 TaxID=2729626 RepID=UPI001472B0D5|nr:squalene cyclase [Planctomonas sp. JC2975]NNC13183.1 squalene cyclase [Planctomonas sp. JC2975]
MELQDDVKTWLLDSDPALRWQVERDLVDAPESVWGATRRRMVTDGMAARLLALQDADGQWDGGAFFPGGAAWFESHPDGSPQPWTATTWTLNTLRDWGLPAEALAGTADRLAAGSRWDYDDLPFWGGEVDVCVNSFTLASGAWLGADVSGLVEWFPEHRLADGGWNCEWIAGSVRSSFHSTLNALRGILYYEKAVGSTPALTEARRSAEEYLLERRLLYRKSTGDVVGAWIDEFAYPLRWRCTALKAVDYFREAALLDGTAPDPRLADAVGLIRAARTTDGTWVQGRSNGGKVWFDVDAPEGEPSKWLTFFATRALEWWDAAADPIEAGADEGAGIERS